jgi:hypothetical protein
MADVEKVIGPPQPPTHIMLPLADAQKILQVLGEVPVKYGVAWVLEVMRKAPQGTVNATKLPAAGDGGGA